MMDLNPYTEERPDFTTSEYLKTLELHRQSEAQEILVPEFQVTMNDLDDISMAEVDLNISDLIIEPAQNSPPTNIINTDIMDIDQPHSQPKSKPKLPTGFLDLPRELRQTILLYTHEAKAATFCEWYEAYSYVDWAIDLREIHPVVTEDVNYVEKKWTREVVIEDGERISHVADEDMRPHAENMRRAAVDEESERLRAVRKRIEMRTRGVAVS